MSSALPLSATITKISNSFWNFFKRTQRLITASKQFTLQRVKGSWRAACETKAVIWPDPLYCEEWKLYRYAVDWLPSQWATLLRDAEVLYFPFHVVFAPQHAPLQLCPRSNAFHRVRENFSNEDHCDVNPRGFSLASWSHLLWFLVSWTLASVIHEKSITKASFSSPIWGKRSLSSQLFWSSPNDNLTLHRLFYKSHYYKVETVAEQLTI